MATVSDYFGSKIPQKTYGRKSASALLVGIEVELEKVLLKQNIYGWSKHKDGSLKDRGMEFVLPVWSTHAEEYLHNLFAALDKPAANSRCSVHIHANVTEFTLEQIKALIILYVIFEKALYRYSGNRWNNNFCVPVQTWGVGLYLKNMSFNSIAVTFPKYSGLNIFPDEGKLGTVEFRHMIGNKNPAYISNWIQIITDLVKYAEKANYNELITSIQEMRHNSEYWSLFKDVFKNTYKSLNYSDIDKDMEHGITFAKLIVED